MRWQSWTSDRQVTIEGLIVEERTDRSFSPGADLTVPEQQVSGNRHGPGSVVGGMLADDRGRRLLADCRQLAISGHQDVSLAGDRGRQHPAIIRIANRERGGVRRR